MTFQLKPIHTKSNTFGFPNSTSKLFFFILNKLKNNKQSNLFSDVYFTPILVDELVKHAHQLIDSNAIGIFNIVGSERMSKYEFGIKLAKHFNFDSGLLNKISINDKSSLVKRPKDMSLSNTKLCQALNCEIASFDEQLQTLKEQKNKDAENQVVLDIIPYGRHYIDEDDIESVVDVLRNGMLTQGPKVLEFEKKVANYVGAKYAVAVANGTAALHLANMALGLGSGDEVITSTNTFVATSNSILYVGAKPVFVDIDPKTLNIDVERIEDTIINQYKWETCIDTNSTWRIGDGTASFYNYIYTLFARCCMSCAALHCI
mgnify:CR=1 FL=1